MRFYLGTHKENWLATVDVPLFVSHRRLAPRKRLPVACGSWALDSGGFTELNLHGGWKTTVSEYIEAVDRYQREIGGLEWAAPMDWMCEPHVLEGTGLSVREHQERTVQNYLDLRDHGPFVPVLQGQQLPDYIVCIDLYAQAGIDVAQEPLVGLGTVCRRQQAPEIARIVHELGVAGIKMHGFGMKSLGLARVAHVLKSADSMAWSTQGRMRWHHHKEQICDTGHDGSCANCLPWALKWRHNVIDRSGLFAEAA